MNMERREVLKAGSGLGLLGLLPELARFGRQCLRIGQHLVNGSLRHGRVLAIDLAQRRLEGRIQAIATSRERVVLGGLGVGRGHRPRAARHHALDGAGRRERRERPPHRSPVEPAVVGRLDAGHPRRASGHPRLHRFDGAVHVDREPPEAAPGAPTRCRFRAPGAAALLRRRERAVDDLDALRSEHAEETPAAESGALDRGLDGVHPLRGVAEPHAKGLLCDRAPRPPR